MENLRFIFEFNDREALSHQSDEKCQQIYADFFATLGLRAELCDFTELVKAKDKFHFKWLAAYGCAVVYWRMNSRSSALAVMGLDGWKSHVHAWTGGREMTARADVTKPFLRQFGPVPSDDMEKIMNLFVSALNSTQSNRQDTKNHKTPSFASAILWKTLQKAGYAATHTSAENHQGGTTDVGRHTGCIPRNTSFPLVLSAVKMILDVSGIPCCEDLFAKAISTYFLKFLVMVVSGIDCYAPRSIDKAFIIIREIEAWMPRIIDEACREWVVDRIEEQHRKLKELKPSIPAEDRFFWCDPLEDTLDGLRSPSFPSIPEYENNDVDTLSKLARAKSEAEKNLYWSSLTSPSVSNGEQDTWLVLAELNAKFWNLAMELDKSDSRQNIAALQKLLKQHSEATAFAQQISNHCPHVMSVDLASCELLAVWIGCCWAHREAINEHPLFQKYSAALDPSDLRHLVLRDKRAIDALRAVQAFLRRHRACSQFPFRDHAATLGLALDFASKSNRLLSLYQTEVDTASQIIDERFNSIKEKQATLRDLDAKLRIAKTKLASAEAATMISSMTNYTTSCYGSMIFTAAHGKIQERERVCRAEVVALENQISRLEKKPPDLLFALPEGKECALRWLFFLFMPQEFIALLALIHLGQSKLWQKVPSVSAPPNNLILWYSHHLKAVSDPLSKALHLGLGSQTPQNTNLKTPGIRSYGRRTGVFFPDSYSESPYWIGTDPFQHTRSEAETVKLFTEKLPNVTGAPLMQQFLPMLPTPQRGNLGVSLKHKKPAWLTHEEFLMFAVLRSFPRNQIRNLLVALTDDLLPFQDVCVNVIIKQLLYHVGDVSWRWDLDSDEGLEQIAKQMERHAELLEESPRNAEKLLLFGSISSFFGQFSRRLLSCAIKFSAISKKFAADVATETAEGTMISPRLKWKEAKFYGYSLLCFALGDCSTSSCLIIAELILLYRNKVLFASDVEESSTLETPIKQMMASRVHEVVECLEQNKHHLTHCLRQVIDNVPDSLDWYSVESSERGCFEAVSDHLYSINILNGTVLVDGIPPGVLPLSITKDPLYRRTFGLRNFEVIVLGTGHYRSARKIDHRYLYEFITHNNTLYIFECDVSSRMQPEKLLLLRRKSLDLPTIILQGYSHWYSETHSCVLLREPFYRNRRVEYFVTEEASFCVPYGFQELSPSKLINQKDSMNYRLLLGNTATSRLLLRIEKDQFIHVTRDTTGSSLRFSLPRCKLDFEQTADGVKSLTFKDFYLQPKQIFDDTLEGVGSYLILSHEDGREIVLIPSGCIQCPKSGVSVNVSDAWDEHRSYHIYDIHARFKHLVAREPLGRLHLAGIYAACSCFLAETRSGKTGAFTATNLVRQCWTNEPLRVDLHQKLAEVSKLSSLCCSLRLMCSYLWMSSNSVRFLHTNEETPRDNRLEIDPLALDEYRQNMYSPRLDPLEEAMLLSTCHVQQTTEDLGTSFHRGCLDFTRQVEDVLQSKCLNKRTIDGDEPSFPLLVPRGSVGVEEKMYADLQSSWKAYCLLDDFKVNFDEHLCRRFLQETQTKRGIVEKKLLDTLECIPSAMGKLSKLSGKIPTVSPIDLLCMSWDESGVFKYNSSFVDRQQTMNLRLEVVDWMCLCVVEDKLFRMLDLNRRQALHDLQEELKSKRSWHPCRHPKWLAFEVEQGLQIRPYQYSIVRQLIENPGSAIQLNMGLGKTSVLVPMLLLELSKPNTPIVRVNLLASIFHVVATDYRSILVASVHHVKLFTMPFNRDIPLEKSHSSVLTDEIAHCRDCNGFLVVTPQHRNSLLLKQHDEGVFVDGLNVKFIDLIDESDAILDCSFQLVYAIGDQVPLPDGDSRWTVIESFLIALARSRSPKITKLLSDPELVHKEASPAGTFPKIRLLSPFRGQEKRLGKALCLEVLHSPPYKLSWMQHLSDEESALLVQIMSDGQFPNVLNVIRTRPLLRKYESDILIARGCIAYGMLFHGLRSRHRVDYGIGNSGKLSAVPFAACDTPKLRSEYTHPDMCIEYTCLSYFHDGLTREQFKDAIGTLQSLGDSAQQTIYRTWIDSVRVGVEEDDLRKYDDVLKVDIDNALQLEIMYNGLKTSMEVVSFWMNNYVFVNETYQFSHRRATSAWNLVESGKAIGFSGTDDNRFLLPLGIQQITPDEERLCATNGSMLDCICKCTSSLIVIGEDEFTPFWKTLLCRCILAEAYCLIDVGGLMAGVINLVAAEFLVASDLPEHFRGVVYYDTVSYVWNVYERENKRHVDLKVSSLHEEECFVYFDQYRCRGSNMRLQPSASAIVTLEPRLTKDRFMQGCARMRKLRPGEQTLMLAGTTEVLTKHSTVKGVLQRIISNTVESNRKGIIEWFERGTDYDRFPEPIPLDVSLESMYGNKIAQYESLASFAQETISHSHVGRCSQEMVKHISDIGNDIKVQVTNLAEECEREIESEEVKEQEQEEAIPEEQPLEEVNWSFHQAFVDAESLFSADFFRVNVWIAKKLGKGISDIKWSDDLYCTVNFWNTIRSNRSPQSYLRPVDAFLMFPDGRVVLVSEYELDRLLPHWWETSGRRTGTNGVQLQHLSLATKDAGLGRDNMPVPNNVLTSMKLFRGYVEFGDLEQRRCLEQHFQGLDSRPLIEKLLSMRSRIRFLERSDLEKFSLDSDDLVLAREQTA